MFVCDAAAAAAAAARGQGILMLEEVSAIDCSESRAASCWSILSSP